MPKKTKKEPEVLTTSKCRGCDGPLVTMPWNSATDVTYCDDSGCALYHQPVKHELSYAERSGSVRTVRERVKRMKNTLLYGGGEDDDD